MTTHVLKTSVIAIGLGLGTLALSGCGGSGAPAPSPSPAPAPAPTPSPANRAPAFTSAATANAAENSSGVLYTATAADADGDPLTFSISGGADAARFAITPAGALSFTASPDFEAPADADGNNVYLVQIGVSDGKTSSALDLAVTVTNVGPDRVLVRRLNGASNYVTVFDLPGDDLNLYPVDRTGEVRGFHRSTMRGNTAVLIDVRNQVSTDGPRGLLGVAVAPDYATSSKLYVYLTNLSGDIEVRRYTAFTTTFDLIIRIPHSANNNNNGGFIGFGPDGYLYIGVGDGGGEGDPQGNAQNRNSLLGKILRLDVSSDAFPGDATRNYAIPAGNPFASVGGAPEIWALGLRNPYRASFDTATGNLWIADVGQNSREEINLMRPTDGGANFGWNVVEGTLPFLDQPQASFTPPVAEYAHGTGPREGSAIIGGYVYRGSIEALQGSYIFGDYGTGNLWSIRTNQVTIGTTLPSSAFTLRNNLPFESGTIDNILGFGTDRFGQIYILDQNDLFVILQPV